MTPVDAPTLQYVTLRLDRVRNTIRRLFIVDGAARLFLAIAAFVAVTFVFDWFFILPRAIRVFLLLGGLAGFGWIAARRIARPAAVPISDDDIALFVERHYPEINDRLISALQLSRNAGPSGFNSPRLVEELVTDANRAVADLDFDRVVVRTRVNQVAGAAAGLFALMALLALIAPNLAGIHLNRMLGGKARWPQRTYLKVADFDEGHRKVVARGDDLVIAVQGRGEKPRRVTLSYDFDSGEEGDERMAEISGAVEEGWLWTASFPRVAGPFSFVVMGNDDRSETHRVEVRNPPSLEEMKVFFEYPDYLGLVSTPADRPEAAANILAPQFTRVRFEASSNEDLEGATLTIGVREKERSTAIEVAADAQGRPRIVRGAFEIAEAYGEYEIGLKAKNGLVNRDLIRYTIKGALDLKPQIAVLDPPGDETATEQCERPLVVETKDDHGLREIAVETKVVGAKSSDWHHLVMGPANNRPPDYGRQADRIRSEHLLKISELGVKAGEFVVVRIHAEDYKNVGDANISKSKEYKFTIVPVTVLEKELQDAIDRIKVNLEGLRRRQQGGYERTGMLDRKYGAIDRLGAEQSGEVKSSALEQNDITSKLDGLRKDVERVTRRGLYNKIFDDTAAAELQKAVEVLKLLSDTADPARPATSALAASYLTQSARASSGSDRRNQLGEAASLQSAVLKGIQDALRHLDRWSNYQEVVRLTREILEEQNRINERIKDLDK